VVQADQTVEVRPVSPGPTEGGMTQIEKGVAPGETVVTDGVDKLQPGSKVKAHPDTAPAAERSQESR